MRQHLHLPAALSLQHPADLSSVRRRLLVSSPIVVLILTAAACLYAFVQMYEVRRWVEHTHMVIEAAEQVSADLTAAESAQRGYIITGEPLFLPRYRDALRDLQRDTTALRSLTADNVRHRARLNTLAGLIGARIGFLDRGIALRNQRSDSVMSPLRFAQGHQAMVAVQGLVRGLELDERELLEQRVATEYWRVRSLILVFLFGFILVGLVAYAVNGVLAGHARAQEEARRRIEEQNEELQQQAVELEVQRDELERQAAELEMSNDELINRSAAAEASARQVRALSAELRRRVDELETMFRMLPIGVCTSDDPACGDMRVNPAFARILRVGEGENVSRSRPDAEALPFRAFRGSRELPAHELTMQKAAATRKPVEGDSFDLHFPDGDVVHMYGSAAPLLDESGEARGAVGAFVDVTERVEAEAQIRRLAERTSMLYALSDALSRAVTPVEVAAAACEWGRGVLGGSACMFAALAPDGLALEPLHFSGMPEDFVSRWPRIPMDMAAPAVDAVKEQEVLHLDSAEERDARYAQIDWPAAHQALTAAPLRIEDRTLGAWVVHFDQPRALSEDDRQLFEGVTAQCAQALERARLYAAESEARRAAEQANQAKLKFLRVMSHDLRTPLNAILGYAELLHDGVAGPVSDSQRNFLGRIRTSTAVLRTLILDILEFARIEAGQFEIRPADLPVSQLLDGVEAIVSEQVRGKGITLVRRDGDPSVTVRADPERARQVLMNLVTNAQKFTAAGGNIVLSYAADDRRVHISVHDNGVGIPPDELERIFEPFVQAHRPQELGVEQGIGLGLPISRELARAMGGEVTADGELGVGSVFTLELPRAPDLVPAAKIEELTPA